MPGWEELVRQTCKASPGHYDVDIANEGSADYPLIVSEVSGAPPRHIAMAFRHVAYKEDPGTDRNQRLRDQAFATAKLMAWSKQMLITAAKLLDSYDAQWSGNYTPDIYDNARYAELAALVMPHVDFRHPSAPDRAKIAARAWGESGVELPKRA